MLNKLKLLLHAKPIFRQRRAAYFVYPMLASVALLSYVRIQGENPLPLTEISLSILFSTLLAQASFFAGIIAVVSILVDLPTYLFSKSKTDGLIKQEAGVIKGSFIVITTCSTILLILFYLA